MRFLLIIIGIAFAFVGIVAIKRKKEATISAVALLLSILSFFLTFVIIEDQNPDSNSSSTQSSQNIEQSGSNQLQSAFSISEKEPTPDDEKNEVERAESMYIGDVNRVGNNFWFFEDEVTDLYDNTFNRYLWWYVSEYSNKEDREERFATNERFKRFRGTLFVGKSDSYVKNSFRMRVYADDKEVWESPTISIESDPYAFDVDIENAKILTLEFEQIEGTSSATDFFQKTTYVYLADGELY